MTYAIKKVSIAIMVTLFVATVCLSMVILPSKVYADSSHYAIGDTGPAGGIIFYVDGSSYLEAAPSDQSSWAYSNISNVLIGTTGTAVGTGQANTNAIIAQPGHTDSAAKICADLIINGYDDWFLPSKDELFWMYQNLYLAGLGGLNGGFYRSSSEFDATDAWEMRFMAGTQLTDHKYWVDQVRAIRAFTIAIAKSHKAITVAALVETPVETPWIRTMPMTCYQVWVNSDNMFEMVFWYPYADNNWVKIYDMSGKEVYSVDMPLDNPHIIVDLPNGMYTVKIFNDDFSTPLQTFTIGKP